MFKKFLAVITLALYSLVAYSEKSTYPIITNLYEGDGYVVRKIDVGETGAYVHHRMKKMYEDSLNKWGNKKNTELFVGMSNSYIGTDGKENYFLLEFHPEHPYQNGVKISKFAKDNHLTIIICLSVKKEGYFIFWPECTKNLEKHEMHIPVNNYFKTTHTIR